MSKSKKGVSKPLFASKTTTLNTEENDRQGNLYTDDSITPTRTKKINNEISTFQQKKYSALYNKNTKSQMLINEPMTSYLKSVRQNTEK